MRKARRAARGRRKGKVVRGELVGPFSDALGQFIEGDASASGRGMEGVLRKARGEGDRDREIAALMNLVTVAGSRADHRRARAWAEQAIKALGTAGAPRFLAIVWFQRGVACLQTRDYPVAVASFEECARLAAHLGDRAMTGHALALEGRARQKAGDGPGAADRYVRAVPLMKKDGAGREMIGWL